jgi:hypothetical protein
MPRQWSLVRKESQLMVCDEPLENQSKKTLLDVIYDLQAIIDAQYREIDTIKEQQDKFLAVLTPTQEDSKDE